MVVSAHGFSEDSPEVLEDVNARWRQFFTLWYETFGDRSVRVYQVAPLANQCGFNLVVPSETWKTNAEGATPTLSRFGMLLRAKHRHVHAGLRLVSDRIELGWSPKTAASTYHVEPKNKPKVYAAQSFHQERGDSEE
jgi:hypothetical protein